MLHVSAIRGQTTKELGEAADLTLLTQSKKRSGSSDGEKLLNL